MVGFTSWCRCGDGGVGTFKWWYIWWAGLGQELASPGHKVTLSRRGHSPKFTNIYPLDVLLCLLFKTTLCFPLSKHLSRDFPNGDVFIHMDWHIWEQNLSLDTFCFATYLRNRIWAEFYNLCTLWLGWMCRSSPAVLVLTAHDGPFYPHLLQPPCFWPLKEKALLEVYWKS